MTTTTTRTRRAATPAITADSPAAMLSPAQQLQRAKMEAERTKLEAEFLVWARGMYQLGLLPLPRLQWKFHPTRDWRYDAGYIGVLVHGQPRTVAIDLDGAIYGRRNPATGEWEAGKRGGHTSGKGYENDREKDCEAAIAGILVLRLSATMLKTGVGFTYIERALGVEPARRAGAVAASTPPRARKRASAATTRKAG